MSLAPCRTCKCRVAELSIPGLGSELDADLPRELALENVAEDVLLHVLVEDVLSHELQRHAVGGEAPAERRIDLRERRRGGAREQDVGPIGLVLIVHADRPESLAGVVRYT